MSTIRSSDGSPPTPRPAGSTGTGAEPDGVAPAPRPAGGANASTDEPIDTAGPPADPRGGDEPAGSAEAPDPAPTRAGAPAPGRDDGERAARPGAPGGVPELATQFEDEKPGRVLTGPAGLLVAGVALAVGLLALWQVFRPLPQGSKYYLIIFLAGILPLVFLAYPADLRLRERLRRTRRSAAGGSTVQEGQRPGDKGRQAAAAARSRPSVTDWALALLALAACLYPVLPLPLGSGGGGYDAFLDRQGLLVPLDLAMGTVLLLLLLEACRRTTGWILPAVCLLFLGYGYYGGLLPQSWPVAHAGLDFSQLVDAFYNSDSGFYGPPLDVAASYIVLFTIYGAVLDLSGAGRFFVELSTAAFRRSRTAAGRTAVASGFLLGTVSGSGAATTVSIGAVTWPILRRAGYPAERAGGMLAAAGVGAILSPPTLGAAAFIIAEYLGVSYLQVLGWATVPTVLYYLGILLSVEIDARRSGVRPVAIDATSPWRLLARFGYHFASLLVIIVLLAVGMSATRAVVLATALAAVLSFLDRANRLTPARLLTALVTGVRGVLAVAAVCAAAGIITATTTKTGLGPQAAALLLDGARAVTSDPTLVLALTAVLAAVALSLLGLAVPVTASFVIGWVIIGPALIDLGVATPAAAMFVFYFAALSEVSPPTALAAVAAAAVTGGRLVPTMWQTLRYALPAYLTPIAFVITPAGLGLLGIGGPRQVAVAAVVVALSVAVLAVAAGGWLPGVGPAGGPERLLAALAGVTLLWLDPVPVAIGVGLAALAVAGVFVRRGSAGRAGGPRAGSPVDLREVGQ
ncbi:TRAP transporter fused permease subunit [Micromonospora sp. WMMD812]|uniref:TRAP transporter permease n=1 Tax=Micromonospora sp. WMMD812 TaxID=3015152 RepID=UPI00248B4AD5|nr:TRAP transporter fused permease subunit [Micromonospora sp. WMMD812]WBB66981.1 TRAP transporter fused permease subunit [Micromonospora sp. WMMD812]